MFIDADQQG